MGVMFYELFGQNAYEFIHELAQTHWNIIVNFMYNRTNHLANKYYH